MLKNHQEQHAGNDQAILSELKAIKRLLALRLLRDGAGQQQVAKAAGVATLTINRLAKVGTANKGQRVAKARAV